MDDQQADGTNPLYHAALTGDLVTVRALLANHVDVNNRNDDNGWTVLMVAAAGDHADVVAELVAQPEIDVNARAEEDRTALHLAAERGHQRVVAALGSHPEIDPNAKDVLGRTALILAAFNGWAGVVELLLTVPGIDPNLVDRDRQTALHWAALGDHVDVVRGLLGDARTNAGITNRPDGNTAQRVAAAAGRDAAAAVLEARMRSDPGIDELSPGDAPPAPPEEAPVFYRRPFVPEPPELGEPE